MNSRGNPSSVQQIVRLLSQKYRLGVPILAIFESLAKPAFYLETVEAQRLINEAERVGLVSRSRNRQRYYANDQALVPIEK